MTYPATITLYPERVNKNASGWYISGEYFNIPASSPYQTYLDHIPKDAASTEVWASGGAEWTEDITGTPSAGEFYVEYNVGRVTFNSADAGDALEARYDTLGDDIMAEHMNNMQDEVYAIELELGRGIPGVYNDLAERLDTFITVSSPVTASQVSIITPAGITSTTVQEFVDLSGTANRSDINPFGIGWNDIYNADGDMVRAQNNITTGYFFANTISASGTQIGINVDGPDSDQFMYFYDSGVANGQWLKWDDDDNRFEFSGDLLVQGSINASGVSIHVEPSGSNTSIQYNDNGYFGGDLDLTWNGSILTTNNITASGNIMPDASGTGYVGTAAIAWGNGHFDNLEVANRIWASGYYGDGSNLTGVTTTTTFIALTDTPAAYATYSASGIRVNGAGTALEFCDLTGAGGGGLNDHDLLNNISWSVAGHIIDANIVPDASGTRDLGTVALAYNDAYIDKVYLESNPTDPLQAATKQYVDSQISSEDFFDRTGTEVSLNNAGDDIVPNASGTEGIGTAALSWGNGHFDNLEAANSIWAKEYYGDGSNLIGVSTDFISLTDTPASYVGYAASGVRVNIGSDGLEFYATSEAIASNHDLLNNLEWSSAGHTIDADIIPTASGTQSVGTAAVAFDEGHFDNLYCNYIYGDGSNLIGISTTTDFISLTNTPANYAGYAASGVRVNPGTDGLEFYATAAAIASDHSSLNNLEWSAAGHIIDSDIIPNSSGTIDVGSADIRFEEGSFNIIDVTASGIRIGSATITAPSGIITFTDASGTYTLGDIIYAAGVTYQ